MTQVGASMIEAVVYMIEASFCMTQAVASMIESSCLHNRSNHLNFAQHKWGVPKEQEQFVYKGRGKVRAYDLRANMVGFDQLYFTCMSMR